MKSTAKLLTAMAAALVLATGAQAQEAQPDAASNLGTAVVGSSQAAGGLFGGLGASGVAIAAMAGLTIAYAVAADESKSTEQPDPPPFRDPEPLPEPPTHHSATQH